MINQRQSFALEFFNDHEAYRFRSKSRHSSAYSYHSHYFRKTCNRTMNRPLQFQEVLASVGVVVMVPWVAPRCSLAAEEALC
jgi:hypothetical protein